MMFFVMILILPLSGNKVVAQELQPHTITALAWNSDGSQLAAGYANGKIEIHNSQTDEIIHLLEFHTGIVPALAWSSDNSRLAAFGDDQTVTVWNTASGELLNHIAFTDRVIMAISWRPETYHLFIGTAFGAYDTDDMQEWNTESGQVVQSVSHFGTVSTLLWNPGQDVFTALGADGTIAFTNPDSILTFVFPSAQPPETEGNPSGEWGMYAAAWHPDGKRLLVGSINGILRVWNVPNGQPLLRMEGADSSSLNPFAPDHRSITMIKAAAFVENTDELVSVSVQGLFSVWDATTGEVITQEQLADIPIMAAAFSPDGTRLAYAGPLCQNGCNNFAQKFSVESRAEKRKTRHGIVEWTASFNGGATAPQPPPLYG